MRIAYLCNRYPSVSTAFIRHEVTAMRRLGVDVHTLSVRAAGEDQLLTEGDREASRTTYAVVPPRWRELIAAHCAAFASRPVAYLRTLALAQRLAPPGARGRLWQLFYFAEAIAVWRRCDELGLRHLHTHFAHQATDVALLATEFGGGDWSWSLNLHGPAEFADASRLRLPAKIEHADLVVCISAFARSQAMAAVDVGHWDKLRVVHQGVDSARFAASSERSAPADGLRLLHVGRLVAVKGQTVLLEAIALARARGVDVRATIVGDGELRGALEQRRDELELGSAVAFAGALGQDVLPRLYAEADVFCLSSFAEGVPVVLMEAMAAGLPVVTPAIAGIPELVDSEVGFLVAPSSAEQIADALERLASSPDLRRRMGGAARRKVVAEFDREATAVELRDVLAELLDERPAADGRGPAGRGGARRVTGARRRASYVEAVGFGGLSFVSLVVLGLVTSVAIARLYGIEVMGEFGLTMAAANAVWFLSSAKERPALVRELAQLEPRAPRVTGIAVPVFLFSFVLTLVVGALGVGLSWLAFDGPIDRPDLFAPAAASIAAYVVLTNSAFNLDTVLTGFRAGRQLFWIRLHQALAFAAVAVLGALLDLGVWGLVAAQTASVTTSLIHRALVVRAFMRWRVPRSELREGFRTLPDVVRFGLKIAPGGVADGVAVDAPTWVLGATGPLTAVGAYNRAYLLSRRLMELNWRVNEVLFPTLVERSANGDRVGYDRVLVDSLRYVAVAMLLPAAVAGGAAGGVMAVFGPGFDAGAGALALLLLVPPLATTSNILRHVLYAADRPWLGTAIAFVRLAVVLAAVVPLSRSLGPTGAALAIVAGIACDVACAAAFARAELTRPFLTLWRPRQLAALAVAYVGGFASARAVYELVPNFGGLALAILASTTAYALLHVVAGGVCERDRGRLARLVAAIRVRRSPAGHLGAA